MGKDRVEVEATVVGGLELTGVILNEQNASLN